MRRSGFAFLLAVALGGPSARAQDGTEVRRTFTVRYVAADGVYLDGGRETGLAEGYRLTVRRREPGEAEMAAVDVGQIVVVSVAANSAACEIQSQSVPLQVGDVAYLSAEDLELVKVMKVSQDARKYAQVVSFTEGDPLEEEVRQYVPRPPSVEVNRARVMVAFDYDALQDHAGGTLTTQEGLLVRADIHRIAGSFWNFTGYWRGRLSSYSGGASTATLDDLLNRTYHIGLYYNNPDSKNTMGFGRLLVPWATSLNTIDGGYWGRRLTKRITAGFFGGSTPDPTAWNYDPNRQIAGGFASLEAGSYEKVRYVSTAGVAITRVHWKAERQFAFFENSFFLKRYLSVYHNLEVDQFVPGRLGNTDSGIHPSRSFLTVRLQPAKFVTFEINDNYFRSVPTFDLRLLGTGLLEKYLFRGWSGGIRFDLADGLSLYGSLGTSSRDTDAQASRNLMFGATLAHFWGHLRLDARHTEFTSSFGKGGYDTMSLTRDLTENLRIEIEGGKQDLHALISNQNRTYFMDSNVDWFFSKHYSLGGGWTLYRGNVQNYDQSFFRIGYRF